MLCDRRDYAFQFVDGASELLLACAERDDDMVQIGTQFVVANWFLRLPNHIPFRGPDLVDYDLGGGPMSAIVSNTVSMKQMSSSMALILDDGSVAVGVSGEHAKIAASIAAYIILI